MADKVKREQTVALKSDGVSNNDIVKQLKVYRKTVYNGNGLHGNNFKSQAQTLVNEFQAESAQFAPKMWFLK